MINRKSNCRNGVVLLITLFFIVALGIVVTTIMTQSENFLRKVNIENFYTQSNLIFYDLESILKSELKDINDSTGIYMVTSLPVLLNDKNSGLGIIMSCKSGATGFNLNCLGLKSDSVEFHKCYDIVESLFYKLKIEDTEKLIDTIADAIDLDKEERSDETEIILENPWFKQGPIETIDRLKQIVHYYALKSEDFNSLKIPWEQYFSFVSNKIDINYINPVLASAIAPEIKPNDIESMKEKGVFPVDSLKDIGIPEDTETKLSKAGVTAYVPILKCSIELNYNDNWSKTEFYYDIEKTAIKYSETLF